MINWRQFFPFKTPRPEQVQAIEFALSSFATKKYVILEMPTGTGKSAVAVTLSRYFQGQSKPAAYIITTQKILQQQYKNDFPLLANISAKQNYVCKNKIGGLTCDFGLIIQKVVLKDGFKDYYPNCVYAREKRIFDTSDIGVTNLHFFLSHANKERSDIKDRILIVVDEAHNLENTVIDYASLQFTQYVVKDILKLDWPPVAKMDINQFMDWVRQVYHKKLENELIAIKFKIEDSQSEAFLTSNAGMSLMRRAGDLGRQLEELERCIADFDEDEWVMSVTPTEDIVDIKPLYAKNYTQPLIFGFADKMLLMSGTILDKKTYCRNVGIPEEEAAFLSLDSPFPIKNRPIFSVRAGSLSRNNIDKTLPNIICIINELLDEHKNEKGIIHCGTYKISNYIEKNIMSDRLLFHSTDDRQHILNFHFGSKKSTVLVSPSFTEGVDLYDDFSRFQIIVKCAFPYLGDNYIRTKMEKIPGWYEYTTAKTMIQASGRSIRHVNDNCVTYILDSDWIWFFNKNRNLFPAWWAKSVVFM